MEQTTAFLYVKGPNGEPIAVRGDALGAINTAPTPSRTPLTATITATSSALELSGATPDGGAASPAAWRLVVAPGGAAVRFGGAAITTTVGVPVAAGDDDIIPSSTLAGWYVISQGADVVVTLVGAEDV